MTGEIRADETGADSEGGAAVTTPAAPPAWAEAPPVEQPVAEAAEYRASTGDEPLREPLRASAPPMPETASVPAPAPARVPAPEFAIAPPPAPAPVAAPAVVPAPVPTLPVSTAADDAPAPSDAPYTLPTDALAALATDAGLEWVNSDAGKIREAQQAIADEPHPKRLPRQPRPAVKVDEAPLVLVETRKDLSQLKLPFDSQQRPSA